MELLKIANKYLPRVRLEYDRLKDEKSSLEAELNTWKAEISNAVRIYQGFCDRNLELKKREDEFLLSISELKVKEAGLQKTIFNKSLSKFQKNNSEKGNLNLDLAVKQEEVILLDDERMPPPNMIINYPLDEKNETLHYPSQVEPSSRTLIFDTKDLPPTIAQT